MVVQSLPIASLFPEEGRKQRVGIRLCIRSRMAIIFGVVAGAT
jgi:hypothetical protein